MTRRRASSPSTMSTASWIMGKERHARSRIRFIDQPHLARLIGEAGLRPTDVYGWWDRTPFGPESQEIIAVMGKPA